MFNPLFDIVAQEQHVFSKALMGDLHLQMPVTRRCCSRSTSSYVKHPADIVLVPLVAAKSHTCAVSCESFFKHAVVCVLVFLVLNAYRNNFTRSLHFSVQDDLEASFHTLYETI